jgi:hypothetical protein
MRRPCAALDALRPHTDARRRPEKLLVSNRFRLFHSIWGSCKNPHDRGGVRDAPLDIHADVGWVYYANAEIRAQMEPALLGVLRERGIL